MRLFEEEARSFGARKFAEIAHARQVAAVSLACGIDLSAALSASSGQKESHIRRIERAIERERLKGMRRHWSYDLNRHIALKQVLDRLRGSAGGALPVDMQAGGQLSAAKSNGASAVSFKPAG